jgi:hypothetical protein
MSFVFAGNRTRYYYRYTAGIVQWQDDCFPSNRREFDSRYPHQVTLDINEHTMQEKFLTDVNLMNQALKEGSEAALLTELEADFGGPEAAEKVLAVQEQKAALMRDLKESLRQLSETGTVGIEGKMRGASYDQETDTLFCFGKGGQKTPLTRGQLLVAGLWGESYHLDESVPYDIKKQYLVQTARYEISNLFDYQIALYEANQRYNQNTGLDSAYQAVTQRYEEDYEIPPGLAAEKMVESLLTKLAIDHHLPYQLKSVSVYEDVEYKIDFIIEPIHEDRGEIGVGVAEPEDRPDIGIQFTTAESELTVQHKKRQVTQSKSRLEREGELKLKDLVLIVLPIHEVAQVYQEWQATKANRRTPGGADELWSEEVRETVFRGVLDKVFSENEVDTMLEQVRGI